MKLTTSHARELFLFGPAGGDRITSVNELVSRSGASERAIRAHLPEWRKESLELAQNRTELLSGFSLREQAFVDHRRDVDFLRSEVERLKKHLLTIPPSHDKYPAVLRNLLTAEKQWAAMSGIQAAIDAVAVKMKEDSRQQVRFEERAAPNSDYLRDENLSVFRRR
jgi:hypothetical protein